MGNDLFLEKYDTIHVKKKGVEYFQFKNLLKYSNIINHGFTTRKGGISSGELSTLNLGLRVHDSLQNVLTNYQIISKALDVDYKNMVLSNQVHDNKIKIVDENDRGKGIVKDSDIIGYDGLITNKKDVVLVTFYADCIPVFFLDPVNKVIGLAHSGWRGTIKEMSIEMINKMKENFGTNYLDIEVAIGPSIGMCCFEVDEDVYREFKSKFGEGEGYYKKDGAKWFINPQMIIKDTLISNGLKEEKINLSNLCTKCNKDLFFSHRGDLGKTGRLAAIMSITG